MKVEFKQCELCKGEDEATPKGFIRYKDENGIIRIRECECHAQYRLRARLVQRAKNAHLDEKYIDYDPDTDYVGDKSRDSVKRIKTFVTRSLSSKEPEEVRDRLKKACLYIYGPNGTQKTAIANWMAYSFLRTTKRAKYFLMNDIVKLLQNERDEDAVAEIDEALNADLLIIDECFDPDKVTLFRSGYQIPFIDTFLRKRVQEYGRGIIFVSNISMDKIDETGKTDKKGYGTSIANFVTRNVKLSKGEISMYDSYINNMNAIDEEELF